ncbi:MAG: hypothetical protein AB7F89_06820 [Pirellulaceae bacterium]
MGWSQLGRQMLTWFTAKPRLVGTGTSPSMLVTGPQSEPTEDDASDRRNGGRKGFNCWQLAAFYDGKRLPPQMDFKLVQCRDVSVEGFSFYHDSLPRSRWLIVAMGTVPFQFYEAEMVRREPAHCERERGWIIGCRVIRQLLPPSSHAR